MKKSYFFPQSDDVDDSECWSHIAGMTKIKMSKEEAGSADFIEKRRASLERFVIEIGRDITCSD